MSLSKSFLLDRDPDLEDVRREVKETWSKRFESFPFRIPTRRRAKVSYTRHWDPIWPACLQRAAQELEIECMWVNEGVFFQTHEQSEVVRARAEELFREEHKRFAREGDNGAWP